MEAKTNSKVMEYFGVTEAETPCLYLAMSAKGEGQMTKFKGPTTEVM